MRWSNVDSRPAAGISGMSVPESLTSNVIEAPGAEIIGGHRLQLAAVPSADGRKRR